MFYIFNAGMVKLSELKGTCTTGKATRVVSGTVPDSLITQRDNAEAFDPEATSGATEPCDMDDAEGAQALRRRPRKTGSDVGESKVKNRRQKDFDPAAVEDSEDEQSPQTHQALREKSATADDVWTQNQQKLLELALQQYPRGTSERWDKIAMVVPGKRKVKYPFTVCLSSFNIPLGYIKDGLDLNGQILTFQ